MLGGYSLVVTLAAVLIFAGITIGLSQFFFHGGVKPGGVLLTMLGFLAWAAVRRGNSALAPLIFCWGTMFCIYAASILQAGLYGSAWAALAVCTVVSAWLLGVRHTVALVVTNVLGVAAVYLMHLQGRSFISPSLEVAAVTYAITPMLGAIIGVKTAASFRRRYRESERLRQQLGLANQDLEKRVAQRSESLVQALDDVKRMQTEIIEHEKLASLGALVAGISHELNTPLGNALTVSSALEERAASLQQMIDSGSLRRSDLTRSVEEVGQAAELIRKSIERSAELIASFKQVSIDQMSERRREFLLDVTINDVIKTLEPLVRKAHCRISFEIPEGIRCDSYPGPLGQVITNLLVNATQHAFEGRTDGSLQIRAQARDDSVRLWVSDNGVGMTSNVAAKAFDPFFTTKLGRGGSGLGLSVCHRICTTVLGGTIQVESTGPQGSTFVMDFPRVAPGRIG